MDILNESFYFLNSVLIVKRYSVLLSFFFSFAENDKERLRGSLIVDVVMLYTGKQTDRVNPEILRIPSRVCKAA